MPYLIASACIDVADKSCTEECLVDAPFFVEPLKGRDEPLGNPSGATNLGYLRFGTTLVAGYGCVDA